MTNQTRQAVEGYIKRGRETRREGYFWGFLAGVITLIVIEAVVLTILVNLG
jgi:hypothetical protein